MVRNNDLMAALLDTRRELGDQLRAVGDRVDGAERDLRQVVTAEVESLRSDIHETRRSVDNRASATTEVARRVSALSHDVSEIRQAVSELRSLMSELAGHQIFDTPAPWTVPAAAVNVQAEPGEQAAEAAVPEPVNSGPAGPPSGSTPQEEAPETSDRRKQPGEAFDAGIEPNEEADHGALLLSAAPIASIVLVCHRDAWNFVADLACGQEHFNPTPEITDDGDGRVRIILSGRSLIGVLIALREARVKGSVFDGSWAMASAYYQRMAEDLRKTRRAGTTPLTIVFNDGVTENNEASPEAG
ncbi:hypothetical protein [Streptomyces odonnellii]|uniref:hypothetical protein n=1 Tax=Streptomyces odonnellii TaxID=1417980 RepID=UPI000626BA6E|nr:hypothetical protein [Streptomyces odonnellii]